jgi:hypothetical protein
MTDLMPPKNVKFLQITSLMSPGDKSDNLFNYSTENDSGLERSTDGDIVQVKHWSGKTNMDKSLAEEIWEKIR